MQELGWRRRWGSCPAARRGARQRAGLTPASASNTLSCLLEMLHSKQLRSIKILVDSNHGIYRVRGCLLRCMSLLNGPSRQAAFFWPTVANAPFSSLLSLPPPHYPASSYILSTPTRPAFPHGVCVIPDTPSPVCVRSCVQLSPLPAVLVLVAHHHLSASRSLRLLRMSFRIARVTRVTLYTRASV